MDGCIRFPPDDPRSLSAHAGQNSYLLYLEYQKIFTTWLVRAAAQFGQRVETGHDLHSNQELVSFAHLVRLVKAVHRRGKVPRKVLDALDFMVKLREGWNPIFPSNNDEDRRRKQAECGSAVKSLRTARHLLRKTTILEQEQDTSILTDTSDERTNIYTLYPLPGEAMFAWDCFFTSLGHIRAYLRKCWRLYREQFESLFVVSRMTDIMILHIKKLCEHQVKVTKHLPHIPAEGNIIEWYFRQSTSLDYPYPRSKDAMARKSCFQAHCALQNVASHPKSPKRSGRRLALDARRLEQVERAWQRQPQMPWLREETSTPLKTSFNFIAGIAMRFHNLGLTVAGGGNIKVLACTQLADNFVTHQFKYRADGPPPTWLSVCFQIMADIKDVLKRSSYRCCGELQAEIKDVRSLFRKYFSHPLIKQKPLKENDCNTRLHNMLWFLEGWYQADAYTAPSESNDEGDFVDKQEDKQPPVFLLRNDPVQCGLMIFRILDTWREFQVVAVSPGGSIAPAAILYMAMRAHGLVGQWDDMEYIRECHRNCHISLIWLSRTV
jgi:hypothetical protein